MKKALIITVGTGTRPDVNIVNPLSKTIKHSNPNYLALICSEDSRKFAEEIIKNISIEENQYLIHEIRDEDDLQNVFKETNEVIRSIISKGFTHKEIDVDFTSGTKAMTGGLVLSAIFNSCAVLKYITGKRKDGIVQDGTERFISIEPTSVFALKDIQTADNFILAMRFDAAKDILNQISPSVLEDDQKQIVRNLALLAEAYSCWDKFDHLKFVGEYSKVKFDLHEIQKYKINKDVIQLLAKIGKDICSGKITEDIIIDLFSNAIRRIDEGKYDDALSRFYRIAEMFAQWNLETDYGIQTGDVDIKKVPKGLQNNFEMMRDRNDNKVQIGLKKSYVLLKEIGSKIGVEYLSNNKLQGILNQRNYSILAHGVKPISKEACESLCKELESLLSLKISQLQVKCRTLDFPWRQKQ